MTEDARYRTKEYLETYLDTNNLTEDDGTTLAKFIVCFGDPDYSLMRVFNDRYVDLVFSIGVPESEPLLDHDQAPYHYIEDVPIEIFCVDKTGITGTKFKWTAEAELRRICEVNPTGSQRSLKTISDNTERLGSTVLHSVKCIMHYERDLT